MEKKPTPPPPPPSEDALICFLKGYLLPTELPAQNDTKHISATQYERHPTE